jgi:cathepsin L
MRHLVALPRPATLVLLLASAVFSLPGAGAQEKPAAKSGKAQRDKLLKLDADLRAAYGKSGNSLPESKRALPDASAPAFDWVPMLGLTPVHQQGGKPNCVAQATIAALEWNWQVRNGTRAKPILSPQPILDRLQKGGALRYTEALDQLLLNGTALLPSYSYTGEPRPVRERVTTPYRLVGYGLAGPRGKSSVGQIKQALLDHGPLVAGVHSTPAFQRYRGRVFAEHFPNIPKDDPTNHAVVLIGWDDRLGKGCWHVQNSWGLKWGEGGGMWIEYGCNNIAYFAYWVRAQSTQYNLPEDAHTLLGDGAKPFHRWPSAKDVTAGTKE